jgi:hypothetical protein
MLSEVNVERLDALMKPAVLQSYDSAIGLNGKADRSRLDRSTAACRWLYYIDFMRHQFNAAQDLSCNSTCFENENRFEVSSKFVASYKKTPSETNHQGSLLI